MYNLLILSFIINAPLNAPLWHLQTNAGPQEQGALYECGPNGVRLGMGKLLAADAWSILTRANTALPARPLTPQVVFTNGDILTGAVLSGDGDALLFRPALSTKAEVLRLPTSALAVLWPKHLPEEEPAWVLAKRTRDVIQLKNGDTLHGSINKLEAANWQLTVKGVQNVVPDNVLALGFNTDLARVRNPKGTYYRVVLRDGSRLRCAAIVADGQTWTLTTLYKEAFTVALADVLQVSVEQGKAVLLSELKAQYTYASFDGEQQSYTVDRNARGSFLSWHSEAGLASADRGLAIPAGGTLAYALAGKLTRLEATLGMDPQLGERGTAQVQVVLDGKPHPLPNDGRLLPRKSVVLSVDLRGVKELKINIQRRDGGAVQAYVNIVEGRLYP